MPFSFVCKGTLHEFDRPAVMGILNVTPDSFYDGGRYLADDKMLEQARRIADEGADIIDVGVVSTRPGAQLLPPEEEAKKLSHAVQLIRRELPNAVISVDTCFALPAQKALDAGADIVNDISGGMFDAELWNVVASYHAPYILMHTTTTPDHMQDDPRYDDILKEVAYYFSEKLDVLYRKGVNDIIIDPGFGFGKTVAHNHELFHHIPDLLALFPKQPLLVAMSRKSMIYKPLGITAEQALPGTVALNAIALHMGAKLIRVHDVKEAVQTVKLLQL
ncbi:MAG: dihydropteroate synthase [Bacteroidales bacterium]|nr:dihydropteroate synthase [Bacteroidales bacterium]